MKDKDGTEDQFIKEQREPRPRIGALGKLKAKYQQFRAANQQLRANEEELRSVHFALGERVKELDYFYRLSTLVEEPEIALEELLQGAVNLIPPSWQYSEITCGRIILGEQEFKTDNFKETAWKQTADLIVRGERCGVLEVCFLEEMPENYEGPFLKEERKCINAIAERLGRIIERKQAEEVLRASRQIREGIINAIPVRVFWKDRNLVYLGCNAMFACDAGFSDPKDIIGKDDYQMAWHDHAELYRSDCRQVIESGCSKLLLEESQTTPEGNTINLLTNKIPLRGPDGEISGVLGTYQDITERKQAEEELRKSEERFRKIFNNTHDCIFIETPEGKILDINQSACLLLGYTRDELLKMRVGDIVPPEIAAQLPPIIQEETVRGGRYIETEELCKDGSRVPVEVSNTIVEIGGEKRVIAVVRDITERKRVEEELRRSEERSRYAQKMEAIGRLSGGISHDFGNLLTAIMGFSELVLQQLDARSPIRQDVNEIIKIAKKAGKLIRQLMAFSRKQALEVKIINLNTLVKDVGKMLHQLVRENIKIDINLTPDRVRVKADPGQLEQVIVNLVVNARDAIPANGKITIKTENVYLDTTACETIYGSRCGKFACLIIRDTGIGMTKEIIEHIFEPFFTTKEPGEGTGLGISTVYGIVKQHEGWVNVYSEPGQGSSFKIYLPVLDLEWGEELLSRIPAEELKGRQERVLMIEDEELVRGVIVRLLRDNGYVVFEADNAAKALKIFKEEKGEFDLIFSDVILPDQDGLSLIDELLELKPELKIIVGSGYIDLKIFGSIIKERKYRLLAKPYTAITLLRTFREILEK